MAVDQREALIAAVRAQVEKERAEKAAKLQREQEAMAFSGKNKPKKEAEGQKKYKTLTPEELAKIQEKKRKKRAEELGIELDENGNPKVQETDTEVLKGPGSNTDEGSDDKTTVLTADMKEGLGGVKKEGGLNSIPEPTGGLNGGLGGGLGSVPTGGLGLDIKVVDNKDGKASFSADGNTVNADESGWVSSDEPAKGKKSQDDIDSIIPNRAGGSADAASMYDIDDEDDSSFAAQAKTIAEKTAEDDKKEKAQQEAHKTKDGQGKNEDEHHDDPKVGKKRSTAGMKRADEELDRIAAAKQKAAARRKAEEEKRKADEQAAEGASLSDEDKKRAEEASKLAAERKAAEEEAKKKAEELAKKRAAETEAKRKAEEFAKKRAEEAAKRKAADAAKRKALEEERKKAAEKARMDAIAEQKETAKLNAKKEIEAADSEIKAAEERLDQIKKAVEDAKKKAEASKAQKVEVKDIPAALKRKLLNAEEARIAAAKLLVDSDTAIEEAVAKVSEVQKEEEQAKADALKEAKVEAEKVKQEAIKAAIAEVEKEAEEAAKASDEKFAKAREDARKDIEAKKQEAYKAAQAKEEEAKNAVADLQKKADLAADEVKKAEEHVTAEFEKVKAAEEGIKSAADKKIAADKVVADAEKAVEDAKKAVENAEKALNDAKAARDLTIKDEEAAKKAKTDAEKLVNDARGKVDTARNAEKAAIKLVDTAKTAVDKAKASGDEEAKKIEEASKERFAAIDADAEKDAKTRASALEGAKKKAEEVAAKKSDDGLSALIDAAVAKAINALSPKRTEAEKAVQAAKDSKAKIAEDLKARDADVKNVEKEIADTKKAAEEEAAKAAGTVSSEEVAELEKKLKDAEKAIEDAKKSKKDAEQRLADADKIDLDLSTVADGGRLPLAAYYLEKYLSIEDADDQIVNAFNTISQNAERPRNVVILGRHGFGQVCVGEDFARSFYDMGICKSKTIAKIKAQALNKVNLGPAMEKLKGGCLVVENAGLVTPARLKEIVELSDSEKFDFVIILTGEIDSITRLFDGCVEVVPDFEHLIELQKVDRNDMGIIALGYMMQRGYLSGEDVSEKLKNIILGMEDGNLDRLIAYLDETITRCDEREKKAGKEDKLILAEDLV